MSRLADRRALAPFLALFIICFAAQGVSSASIGSWNDNEDVYTESNALTEILSLSTEVYAKNARVPAIFTCVAHYLKDITDVAVRGVQIVSEFNALVLEAANNFRKCAADWKCMLRVALATVGKGLQSFNKVSAFIVDAKSVLDKVTKCNREGGPIPEPPPPSPTNPPPPTDPPTEATDPPTEATDPPTEATDPPTEATDPPTDATDPPTEATDPPTDATDPPTEATDPPTEATDAN